VTERESIARGKMKDIVCFLREKGAQMVGERKERTIEIQTNVQLKYVGARDCGMSKQLVTHRHTATDRGSDPFFQLLCLPARHR